MEKIVVISAAEDILKEGHSGSLGNKPEERKRLVQAALKSDSASKFDFRIVETPELNLDLAAKVHDPGMLKFLEDAWKDWVAIIRKYPNPIMLDIFAGAIEVEGLDGKKELKRVRELKEGDPVPPFVCNFGFASRHDGVQDVSQGSVLAKMAYYSCHVFTPIHESTLPTLKWDLAVVRKSVQTLLTKESRIVYAQNIHPGHHAGPATFGGFCFINQAAVATVLLREKIERVAVVDVDYHHGNGTMACFWNDPNVFFASLHGDPNFEYPFTSGYAHQEGGEKAKGSTLNVPLPGGTTWVEYKNALQLVIEKVRSFGAQALVISLGLDTLKDDPVTFPQARFAFQLADFAEMGAMFLDPGHGFDIPILIIQEGGYIMDQVPQAVLNFLEMKPL